MDGEREWERITVMTSKWRRMGCQAEWKVGRAGAG